MNKNEIKKRCTLYKIYFTPELVDILPLAVMAKLPCTVIVGTRLFFRNVLTVRSILSFQLNTRKIN